MRLDLSQRAQPAPSSAPEPSSDSSFRLELRTDLVLVPVVVRDGIGGSIGNLTKENFEIFDKGKREEIASFTMETRNTEAMGSGSAARAQSGADAGPAAGGSATYTVYFFDDTHIELGELAIARDAVLREINDLAVTDRAAIITTSGMVQLSFTNDREKLKDALMKAEDSADGERIGEMSDHHVLHGNQILQGFRDAIVSATQELILCQSLTPSRQRLRPTW